MNEVEKEFFRYFGVKKIKGWECIDKGHVWGFKKVLMYPKITDFALVKLVCILNKYMILWTGKGNSYSSYEYQDLKLEILKECVFKHKMLNNVQLNRAEDFKKDIQTLFKNPMIRDETKIERAIKND